MRFIWIPSYVGNPKHGHGVRLMRAAWDKQSVDTEDLGSHTYLEPLARNNSQEYESCYHKAFWPGFCKTN